MVPFALFSTYEQMSYHSLNITIGHVDELTFTWKNRRPIIQFLFIKSATIVLICISLFPHTRLSQLFLINLMVILYGPL